MRVLLQIPEGMKAKLLEIIREREKDGEEIFAYLEPCYGACDIPENEAKLLGCEKVLHYAHTKFMDTSIPVEYVECLEEVEIDRAVQRELQKIKEKILAIGCSLQFANFLWKVKEYLEKLGKKVLVSEERKNGRYFYPGQILGCDHSQLLSLESWAEAFLVISSGKFHAVGMAMKTNKPVYLLDVERKRVEKISAERFLKQKMIAQELAKDARKIGIIISTKLGQFNLQLAERIKRVCETHGREAYFFVVNEIKPEKFEFIPVDCLVNTACPRVAIEERSLYNVPLLNADEFLEIFK